jgi:zinc protease
MRLPAAVLLAGALALSFICCRSSEGELSRLEDVASAPVVAPRAWTHEHSDIPVDPRLRFGHFDNGLRWAWAENSEPEKRCYLRLHVDAGSLAEEESELGMAHFLEHMAFNGSEHFPAGTLIEWFQKHGMSFGADTNAHTAFSETVYKLDLPNSDETTLREGLLVLRDFADGLLLEAPEVEAEKGVIDGEERERDSAGWRVLQRQLELEFEGTRIGRRLPIGETAVRAAFTADSVRAFYERWYRPEHMTLIVVGDLGGLDPVPLLAEYFATLPVPAAPLVAEPGPGRALRCDHAYSIFENEITRVSIAIQRLEPWREKPVTVAEWLEELPLLNARSMLNLRFSELAKQETAPFLSAGVGSASVLEIFDGEALVIECEPERWGEALAFCERELRRALEFGFQGAELAELRAGALRGLDEAVERERSEPSGVLVERLLNAAEERHVPTDARARRSILRPAIEALTVEACHAALREAWSKGELSITATGNLDLGDEGGRELLDAYEASQRVPVEAGAQIETLEFAYASSPEDTGELVSREYVEDLDFWRLRFANGVSLNIKSTDFREQQILVSCALGEGRLTLEPQRSVLEWVGSRVFQAGGLEAHSADDLRRLTAGKQVGLGFGISPDSFHLSGQTTAEDLLLQCELLCAHLEAPGWRDDGLVQLRRGLRSMYVDLKHQSEGPLSLEFLPAVFSNDPRIGLPSEAAVAAVEMSDLREWLGPELRQAALEVSIVGDLELDETLAIAARTFGKLPPRLEWRPFEERRHMPTPRSGLRETHEIETEVPKSLVLLVFPIPDGIDPTLRRGFTALESVVNDRLRLEVRERLGASYSPGAFVNQSSVHPGVGLLFMRAESDPEKVESLVEACLEVASALATQGVTDEEVERLREPILNGRRDAKRTNGYWMGVLSRAQRDAQHLDQVRTADAYYQSYRAADLSPLATEYLAPARASILVVNPKR